MICRRKNRAREHVLPLKLLQKNLRELHRAIYDLDTWPLDTVSIPWVQYMSMKVPPYETRISFELAK